MIFRNKSFSDFQYGFRSSRLTAKLLTVEVDGIARVLHMSSATLALIQRLFVGFDIQIFYTDLSFMEFLFRFSTLFP